MGSVETAPLPSVERVEKGSFPVHTASFPKSIIPATENPAAIAESWVSQFNSVFKQGNWSDLDGLFTSGSYWKDQLCLSWDFRTLHGPETIFKFLKSDRKGLSIKSVTIDVSQPHRIPSIADLDYPGNVHCVRVWLDIETSTGKALGLAKLVRDEDGKWKAFTLFTTLRELTGYEEAVGWRRPLGVDHRGRIGKLNWLDRRVAEDKFESTDPTVLIVGAGQGGLTIAARLKQLGISSLIIDQNDRVGDNWRKRYHQLVLHDPVWYDHMPYLEFPKNWPVFTPKDKLGEWFEAYVKIMELAVWNSTTIENAKWNGESQSWTVDLKGWKGGDTWHRTLHPKHIIQATGHSGEKNMPNIEGIKDFKGDRLCHSSEYAGAKENGSGKKAIVVGCCNSGHDIAQDFYDKGYDTTIVQRSTTSVVSTKCVLDIAIGEDYSEGAIPVDDADILNMGIPYPVVKRIHIDHHKEVKIRDKEIRDGLTAAGFALDDGPGGAGFHMKYIQRGGGYYIDVGASQLIIDRKIKVVQGQEISRINAHSITFANGLELEADEIVFATGYQNMRGTARKIFGDQIADKLKDVWGLDEEGEMRTIWKRSGHPGFWFMGGNLAFCRYYSRLLALQIKAQEVGLTEKEG